jgi:hypothetical protein
MSLLIERIAWAKENLEPVQTDLCVVFEDDMDAPAKVLHPAPEWMAMALHGNLLPPVEVYHDLEIDERGHITNGHILHNTPPVPAMTEQEAIEYLIMKDIPRKVWDAPPGNAPRFVICTRDNLPKTREFRNAWRLAP